MSAVSELEFIVPDASVYQCGEVLTNSRVIPHATRYYLNVLHQGEAKQLSLSRSKLLQIQRLASTPPKQSAIKRFFMWVLGMELVPYFKATRTEVREDYKFECDWIWMQKKRK